MIRKCILAGFILLLFCTVACKEDKKVAESGDVKIQRLKLPEGFKAERLYGPSENGEGSWVSMAFDPKGRLLASDQYGALYRLKIPAIGSTDSVQIERIKLTAPGHESDSSIGIGYAQGLLWAFNSLYVMINHEKNDEFSKGSGLYRLQDKDQDDQFETITLLKEFDGAGEHGPHSIILSPDKKSLFIIAGNYTKAPAMNAYRLPANFKEDNIFPLITDPNGHAAELRAPGGWIANIDSTGKRLELYSAGYRNAYDLTLNEAGDLFTFDSDMEWDLGLPWYRPTRICHVTSGSEFGWRTGTTPWSPTNPDNLPPVINIGQGSPTNLVFGGNAKFPDKYKRSLFAFDWSFGIIYAIHLKPEGSSYTATGEEFVSGTPLPLTDGAIGPDGALYFLTGGRRLESDLYRVFYEGDSAKIELPTVSLTAEQQLRRDLEAFHGQPQAEALDKAWPHLNNPDRFIRYAARIAIEHQPVATWQNRALSEKDPSAATYAMIALARQGNTSARDQIFNKLLKIDFEPLKEDQRLDIVRAFELTLLRMGLPTGPLKNNVVAYLDKNYPADNNTLNRSLSKVLIALEAPNAVKKTMTLLQSAKDDSDEKNLTASADLIMRNPQYGTDIAGMLANMPPAQQTYYATALSVAKTGWTPDLQEKYFEWFYKAFSYKGGHSFSGYIDKARKNALQNVAADKVEYYNTISGDSLADQNGGIVMNEKNQPKGPGRNWNLAEALAIAEGDLIKRDFEKGHAMFSGSLCISCHTIGSEGGAAGPNLTQLGTRFTTKDILEAIIEPSKTISDQYNATVFFLKTGGSVIGRLVKEDDAKYYVAQNPFAPQTVRDIPKDQVVRSIPSEVSPMPPGTINRLNEDELKDLLAYLMSGGNKDHEIYTGKKP
ncbi:MAG: heme-binding protein [Chryseolinea sp.]